jgi:hypothetical protein
MNVWWCNQSTSWEVEFGAGVVRSSAQTADDRHRRTVAEARRGDIVVHYRSPNVVAFSRAEEDGHSEARLPAEYGSGWEFRTEYFVLNRRIPRERFRSLIPVPAFKGFALNPEGRVNQGYFFRFTLDGLAALLQLTSADESMPDWLSLIADPGNAVDSDFDVLLAEGQRYRIHLGRERNPALAAAAKAVHGYICQACAFDFEAVYGARGREYIEAHHRVPLHTTEANADLHLSPKSDFAVVCANCHRMLHREPHVSVEALRKQLQARQTSTAGDRGPT